MLILSYDLYLRKQHEPTQTYNLQVIFKKRVIGLMECRNIRHPQIQMFFAFDVKFASHVNISEISKCRNLKKSYPNNIQSMTFNYSRSAYCSHSPPAQAFYIVKQLTESCSVACAISFRLF
jgi:hypothetical protein